MPLPFALRLSFLLFAFLTFNTWAANIPSPPQIGASGYLLMDYDSGKILAEKNANEVLQPASLTKIMTAYTVFKELQANNIGLDDEVLVSEKAWRTEGSRMFIEVNKRVRLQDLLKGMIIQSGNDASVALAEHVAGSEEAFAALMNEQAQRLGMLDSHFVNSTGLPAEGHVTTPADIAKVTIASIRDFPQYHDWYAQKEMTWNNIRQPNRNRLLWRDPSVDGMKTGHTKSAGYCLVATAKRKNMRLVSVVMGTASDKARSAESLKLLNYGFRFYETHKLYAAGQALQKPRIYKGAGEQIAVGPAKDIFVTIPRGQYEQLQPALNIHTPLIAPLSKGQTVGRLKVTLAGETLVNIPIVALQDVKEGGLMHGAADSVRLWFE